MTRPAGTLLTLPGVDGVWQIVRPHWTGDRRLFGYRVRPVEGGPTMLVRPREVKVITRREAMAPKTITKIQSSQLECLRMIDPRREPGECGECRSVYDFEWHLDRFENNAPVMVCHAHSGLAPGWVYDGPIL